MTTRSTLAAVSAAQLAVGLVGAAVAVRRRRNYDLGYKKGSPDRVGRDAVWSGTAYSAPLPMLAMQAWATARLRRGPDDLARRVVGLLGVLMVPGYLMERSGRAHLRPGGLDPIETPVVLAGLGLAAAMGVLGHRDRSGR